SLVTDENNVAGVSYQWQRSGDNGASWNAIDGATGSTYTLDDDHQNARERQHSASTDDTGQATAADSGATSVVKDVAPLLSVSASGSALSLHAALAISSLVTDENNVAGVSYQWQRSGDNGASWNAIDGATGST